MRLIFMGTPEFAVPALEALARNGHEIACVYSQPPRAAGRGMKNRPTPVQQCAEALGLRLRCPQSLRDPDEIAAFAEINADAAIVVAYGMILPREALETPALGCLNIHPSLLPRWRGAAPIQRAIMAGDRETGICVMQMDEGLDTGPVLLRAATSVGSTETAGELHDRLSQMGARMIVEALAEIDSLAPEQQSAEGVSHASKISKAEAMIEWTLPASEVDRKIRGLSPFPGAWTTYAGERIKFLGSEFAEGQGAPGEVLSSLVVACGADAVRITRLQRAGKGAMAAGDALRGWAIEPGCRIGSG